MGRLVLHIGLHKTGTTSIQRMINKDRERLRRQGVYVPVAGRRTPKSAHHNLVSTIDGDDQFNPAHGTVDDLLAEVASIGSSTVLISSERFDGIERTSAKYEAIAEIAKRLRRELVIMAFVRDHVSAINSRYTQEIKTFKHARTFNEYLGLQRRDPYWRYRDLFEGYERIADRMIVLPYRGDTTATFCEQLGLRIDLSRHVNRNPSVGPKTIEACRVLFRNGGVPGMAPENSNSHSDFLSSLGVRKIATQLGWDNVPYWGFTAETAKQAHAALAPEDEAFLSRYGIQFDLSHLDRPCNDISLDVMQSAERDELLAVLSGLSPR